MSGFVATVAEQLSLVIADQLEEARLLVLTAFGAVPRCVRCGELIHEPSPIVAGRCPPCEDVVDRAADGQLDQDKTEVAKPALVRRNAGLFDDGNDRRRAPMFGRDGGGI